MDIKNKEVLKAKDDDVGVEIVCYSKNVSQENDSWVKILKKKYKNQSIDFGLKKDNFGNNSIETYKKKFWLQKILSKQWMTKER